MIIQLLKDSDKNLWNSYVIRHPESVLYHMIGWKNVIEHTFGHKTYYLIAKSSQGEIIGILPLVLMKSSIFGRLIACPYGVALSAPFAVLDNLVPHVHPIMHAILLGCALYGLGLPPTIWA